jgi:tagatose 1,6-diphosphate aldolase
MSEPSTGKKRCLHQITTPSGYFGVLAMDQREDSLGQMLASAGLPDDWPAMVEFKVAACEALADCASAVLLDPVAGLQAAIARSALPGQRGLLVTAEDLGFVEDPGGRRSEIAPGMNAEMVRRLGGQALKFLIYARLERPAALSRQEAAVGALAEDCSRADLLLVVEPLTYRLPDESADEYQRSRPETVLEVARLLESWGGDVLKLEFPWPLDTPEGEARAAESCQLLTESVNIPWAVLSAGVDFDMFSRQVAIAVEHGASGFIAGRAVWKEAATLAGEERAEFLHTEARRRLEQLMNLLP